MDIIDWRKRIDEIDLELVHLLNERTRCAVQIGKRRYQQGGALHDPAREQEVLEQVQRSSTGPLKPDAVQRLFECIMDEARRAARLAATGSEE